MDNHLARSYTVTEVREIIGLICDVSNLSSEKIIGMVCLVDLLNHIEDRRLGGGLDRDVEAEVRTFCREAHIK